MRRAVLIVLMIFAVSLAMDPPSAKRGSLPAGNANPFEYPRLTELVPASAILAIEFRDIGRRWEEIRSVGAISGFLDSVISSAGMDPALAPRMMGNEAVLFLARSEQRPYVVPITILRPPDFDQALAALAGIPNLSIRIGSAALWLGPAGHEETLEFFSRTEGARLFELLPHEEIQERLPPGGLMRGFVNPPALQVFLRNLQTETSDSLLQWPIAAIIAELDAVRYMAFRRNLEDGTITIDGIVAYDPGLLPPELSSTFNPDAAPVTLPSPLPSGTMAVFSFRPEAQTWIPWMRALAAGDTHGPLRNLGFWIDEFQERYHRDLHGVLQSGVGQRGWLVTRRSEDSPSVNAFFVIETRQSSLLEATLADYMSWMAGRIWLETFGTVFARPWREIREGHVVQGITLQTPISVAEGPCFEFMNEYLIIGGNPAALEAARAWVKRLESPETYPGAAEDTVPVHAALTVQGRELAELIRAIGQKNGGESLANLCDAMARLAADFQDIRLNMSYETDGLRMHGLVRFAGR